VNSDPDVGGLPAHQESYLTKLAPKTDLGQRFLLAKRVEQRLAELEKSSFINVATIHAWVEMHRAAVVSTTGSFDEHAATLLTLSAAAYEAWVDRPTWPGLLMYEAEQRIGKKAFATQKAWAAAQMSAIAEELAQQRS
jgi:hypothetical protein